MSCQVHEIHCRFAVLVPSHSRLFPHPDVTYPRSIRGPAPTCRLLLASPTCVRLEVCTSTRPGLVRSVPNQFSNGAWRARSDT